MATDNHNDTTGTEPHAVSRAVLKQVGDGRRHQALPFPRNARVRVVPTTAGADLIVTRVTRAWAQVDGRWSAEATALADSLAEIAREYDGVCVLVDFGDGGPQPFTPHDA